MTALNPSIRLTASPARRVPCAAAFRATFAALSVIPILFVVQIAFIVTVGVLLDTFVVRSLLVPALAYDIGQAIWWPSKLS